MTEVDKAVETYIREQISKAYPDHELWVYLAGRRGRRIKGYGTADKRSIGEETYKGEPITNAPTWIGT